MLARLISVGLLLLAGTAQAQIPVCLTRGGPLHIYQEEEEHHLLAVVRQVRFANVHRVPIIEQEKIARSLRGKRYYDSDWLDSLRERVSFAWQERGYFKAVVQPRYRVLGHHGTAKQIAVTFSVEEGVQYRLSALSFKNNRVFDSQQLEEVFPLRPGDIFNTNRVRQGLEALRRLYGAKGYINFTSVPDTQIDDEKRTIDLTIDLDEGAQFSYREVEFLGLNPAATEKLRQDWKPRRGEPFNAEYLAQFWEEHKALFPRNSSLEINTERKLHERRHTVDVTLDFRPPRDDTEICELLGIDPRLYQKTSDHKH